MTNLVSLTLESVSYQLPDGRFLFSDLNEKIDSRPTGLVGRNGIGKSILAAILAGELAPSVGRCFRSGTVYYVPQHQALHDDCTVAELARVSHIVDALDAIERGCADASLFETVGERWHIRQQFQQALDSHRLSNLQADTPIAQLSGGEIMRVTLIGAFLSRADWLILDEPTNHLDRESRHALIEQLRDWKSGLIVISHDRALLENMSRIIELSSHGLRSYGGGYSFYAQVKKLEQENATAQLEHCKAERKREERKLREQKERLEQRQMRGKKQASHANQAKILLGRQKERSEISASKLLAKQANARDALSLQMREAAQRIENDTQIVLYTPAEDGFIPEKILTLKNAVLPFVDEGTRKINLTITKTQRVGLVGPNGSGKSTLLRMFAGLLAPLSGRCDIAVKAALLDQHLTLLRPEKSVLEQALAMNSRWGESVIRTRLAQLGLTADRIELPTHLLSGGERMKAALACALYADEPPGILLLDEPSNHLDMVSIEALEIMLRQYRGALIIVSHDEIFLDNLQLTHRLTTNQGEWLMESW